MKQAKSKKIFTNRYGQVSIAGGVPKGHAHIPASTYGRKYINEICRAVGCCCAPAFIGCQSSGEKLIPVIDGIVVLAEFKDLVMAEIERRKHPEPKHSTRGRPPNDGSGVDYPEFTL